MQAVQIFDAIVPSSGGGKTAEAKGPAPQRAGDDFGTVMNRSAEKPAPQSPTSRRGDPSQADTDKSEKSTTEGSETDADVIIADAQDVVVAPPVVATPEASGDEGFLPVTDAAAATKQTDSDIGLSSAPVLTNVVGEETGIAAKIPSDPDLPSIATRDLVRTAAPVPLQASAAQTQVPVAPPTPVAATSLPLQQVSPDSVAEKPATPTPMPPLQPAPVAREGMPQSLPASMPSAAVPTATERAGALPSVSTFAAEGSEKPVALQTDLRSTTASPPVQNIPVGVSQGTSNAPNIVAAVSPERVGLPEQAIAPKLEATATPVPTTPQPVATQAPMPGLHMPAAVPTPPQQTVTAATAISDPLVETGFSSIDGMAIEEGFRMSGDWGSGGGQGDFRSVFAAQARAGLDGPMPRFLAQQLAEAARAGPDRPVEIMLEPAELGRVRMTLSPGDGTMVVNLLAERAETADLLRRNLETLAQEFHALGYQDVQFSFADGQAQADNGEQSDRSDSPNRRADSASAYADERNTAPVQVMLTDRMDLRL